MKIAIISSSTRMKRNSHRVALALQKNISQKNHEAVILDVLEKPLPLFTERYSLLSDNEKTENMDFFAEQMQSSKALIFVSPEYNGSISASMKNIIDTFGKNEYANKPVAVATVSTGMMGGMRAAQHLQQIILAIRAFPHPQMLLTGDVANQLDEMGNIINESYQKKLDTFADSLLDFTSKF